MASRNIMNTVGYCDLSKGKKVDLPGPIGFTKAYEVTEVPLKSMVEEKRKKAWSIATAPAGQVFMNLFMMWMMGNSLHIFTIFFLFC